MTRSHPSPVYKVPYDRQLFMVTMDAFTNFDWYQRVSLDLLDGCRKAEALLLFALCSRLHELRLGVDYTFKTAGYRDSRRDGLLCKHTNGLSIATCIASVLGRSTSASYQDLKTAEVYDSPELDEGWDSSASFAISGALLNLPCLEKLGMSSCRIEGLQNLPAGGRSNELNISSLRLEDCEIDSEQVATLLKSCRA